MKKNVFSFKAFIATALFFFSIPLSIATDAGAILGNNVYDSNLGFSVLFPPGWENHMVTARTLDFGEQGTASAVDIGFPAAMDMLTISRYSIDQWNNLTASIDGPLPSKLGMAENFVIAFSVNLETFNEEGQWILDHIAVHAKTLSDIDGAPNQAAIQYLLDTMIISGYPDGTFRPEDNINRAELMKIITVASGAMPSAGQYNNCFPDVTDEWFAVYVCYAKQQNWVQGYPDGTFMPGNAINKVEALKMIINSQGVSIPGAVNGTIFDDVDNSAWYAPFVKAAKDDSLLEQTEGVYGVGDLITRGEVSENIYRALLVAAFEVSGMTPVAVDQSPEEIITGIEGYAVFDSSSYNFSIEYPGQWYYAATTTDPFSSLRAYEFGPGLVDEEPALVTLEIDPGGEAPDGTIVEMNNKTLVLVEENGQINVYFVGEQTSRLFHLLGDLEFEDILLNMASSIEDRKPEVQSGY